MWPPNPPSLFPCRLPPSTRTFRETPFNGASTSHCRPDTVSKPKYATRVARFRGVGGYRGQLMTGRIPRTTIGTCEYSECSSSRGTYCRRPRDLVLTSPLDSHSLLLNSRLETLISGMPLARR